MYATHQTLAFSLSLHSFPLHRLVLLHKAKARHSSSQPNHFSVFGHCEALLVLVIFQSIVMSASAFAGLSRVADHSKADLISSALSKGGARELFNVNAVMDVAATAHSDTYKKDLVDALLADPLVRAVVKNMDNEADLRTCLRLCHADTYKIDVLEKIVSLDHRANWPVTWLPVVLQGFYSDTYRSDAIGHVISRIESKTSDSRGLSLRTAVHNTLRYISSDTYRKDVLAKIATRCTMTSHEEAIETLKAFSSDTYRIDALGIVLDSVDGSECALAEDVSLRALVACFSDASYKQDAIQKLQNARRSVLGESAALASDLAELERTSQQSGGISIIGGGAGTSYVCINGVSLTVRNGRVEISGSGSRGGGIYNINGRGIDVSLGGSSNVQVINEALVQPVAVPASQATNRQQQAQAQAQAQPQPQSQPQPQATPVMPLPKGHSLNAQGVIVPDGEHKLARDSEDAPACTVCLDNAPNAFIEPCHHGCLCVPCAKKLALDDDHRCPQCRSIMEKITWVFV